MSKGEPPALPPETAELLAAERGRPGPPAGASARVWTRLEGSIAVGAPPPPAASAPAAPPAAAIGAASGPAVKLLSAVLAPVTVITLAVGSGVWMSREVDKAASTRPTAEGEGRIAAPVATPTLEAPRPVPAKEELGVAALPPGGPGTRAEPSVTVVEESHDDRPSSPETRARERVLSVAPSTRAARATERLDPLAPSNASPVLDEESSSAIPLPSDADLAAERSILEAARRALLEGDAKVARELLTKHARLFETGRLVEQRESLWVQALVAAGDVVGARARLAAFRARFPRSVFLPVLDATLRAPERR